MTLTHYSLKHYVNELNKINLLTNEELFGQDEATVTGLEFNSKKVKPGTLFICKGANFKKEFLLEAIERGAIGYVAEEKYEIDEKLPALFVSDIREAMAPLADLFFNSPQEKLKIIGIGGTKGKTTTAYYMKLILDEYLKSADQLPAGLISTISTYDGLTEEESKNTTPEALDLQRHLANAVEAGLEYMVMEVSSQALKYHRTDEVQFDVGIFLNIDEDHISPVEHPNFEDYIKSKAKMFGQTKELIVNRETKEADYLLKRAQEAENYYTFSLVASEADYYAYDVETIDLESNFSVRAKDFEENYTLSMPGEFNVENALSAIAAIDLLGIPQKFAQQALSKARVPGRMGIFSTTDKQIIAISDYAHNRLSFEQLTLSMRKAYPGYKVVSVFGAPGGKALGRRKELGEVGGKYSDIVYITMDDPEFEEVSEISQEIARYVEAENTPYEIIENREEAIKTAFQYVEDKTILLVIGKGHETAMKINGKNVSMKSDDQVIQEAIEQYNQKNV
jgi:UDP-N-acetylmuramoyl-L-alanyl-D-glutamate--2,6-diaminopimelate ligase